MSKYTEYPKYTIKQLKELDIYKSLESRSKLKLKKDIVDAIYRKVNETRHGSFTGIRFVDSLIFLYLSDKDLKSGY